MGAFQGARERGVPRDGVVGGGAPPVVLGGDRVAEFVKESVAGVFELELAVVGGEVKNEEEEHHGRRDSSSVSATCNLKLSLPTATAPVAFTGVKCTS